MLLEIDLLKMQIHSLPAGGAFGANSGFGCIVAVVLMNAALSDKMKSKLFWRHSVTKSFNLIFILSDKAAVMSTTATYIYI